MGSSAPLTTARILCVSLIASLLLFTGGCSSLKVVESWHKPAAEARRYQKIMILGVNRDENLRRLFENIVVGELDRHGVVAIAGHTSIPDMGKTNLEAISAAVRAAGCDAVLTTRPLSVGDSKVTQGGEKGSIYGAGARNTYDFLSATLQTSLYDSATQEMVWSATVTTFDADREVRVSRELATFFFENLRRDGFL
jgi:hypothetical protein